MSRLDEPSAAERGPDPAVLRARLTPLQYAVTQEAGTERPFTGVYWDHHGDGAYRYVVCHEPLFDSDGGQRHDDHIVPVAARLAGSNDIDHSTRVSTAHGGSS